MVVDDDADVRDYLAGVLEIEGYACTCFASGVEALAHLSAAQEPVDLVLADIDLPGVSGMDVLRAAKSADPDVPVILISGLYELALALDALNNGADDYLRKPVNPGDVANTVSKYLQATTDERKSEIQAALDVLVREGIKDRGRAACVREIIERLGFKRYETFQHSQRVAAVSRLFGERCRMDEEDLDQLELGALLHDIGKVGVPRNVLLKPQSLTADEWRVMRAHPEIGYRLLSEYPSLSKAAEVVYAHHERFDGGGYPRGLKGDAIPLSARLFAIVDAFDALTSDRSYRAGRPIEAAVEVIRGDMGTHFDPVLAPIFFTIPSEQLQAIRARYPDPRPDA